MAPGFPAGAPARLIGVICLLLWSIASAAQVQVSSPLEGYYRPGKFMPLRVRTAAYGQFVIRPDNGIATQVMLSAGQHDLIVPLLLMGTNRQIRYRLENGDGGFADTELRTLGDDQRLVGFVGSPDVPFARSLFPGASIIPLKLPAATAMAGAAAAWNTLDALVVDGDTLGEARVGELIAAGITLAVRSADKPAGRWPWTLSGACWVLRADPLGPVMAGENQPALAPVSGWEADWPAPFRRRVLLYGAVFIVLALGTTLLPQRWAAMAIIVVSACATVAVRVWATDHPVVLRKTATVLVRSGAGQTDRWIWLAASNPGPATVPFAGCTLPLFQGPHWQLMGVTLVCDSAGLPRFYELNMRPELKIAFVSRTGVARPEEAVLTTAAGQTADPIDRLADRAYLQPGWQIAGKRSGVSASIYIEDWGTVVLERPIIGPQSK